MKKLRPSFIPAVGWLIFSTALLTLPGSSFPKEDWLGKIWFDKWVHIGMFTIMVVLWCWAILKIYSGNNNKLKRLFLLVAAIALGYGIIMEFIQLYFISNRSFDTGDIIADGLGCGIGLLYSRWRYIKK